MHPLAKLDHRYLWHPFTQMRDWLKREPILIVAGKGAVLRDVRGQEYLDANSSIWTNLHGHNHPRLNAAIRRQLTRIAHSSALGLSNAPASRLAAKLIAAANQPFEVAADVSPRLRSGAELAPAHVGRHVPSTHGTKRQTPQPGQQPALRKVFFSDDGSTAMEVALKLAYEFTRRTGRSRKPRFLALDGAYHGDTLGAVALGHLDLFHKAYAGLLFKTDKVMAPYCYRCPFNRAKPERADARDYRKCNWECVGKLEQKFRTQKKRGNPYAAFVFEPLMQGAAGMIPQPAGWLRRAAEIARGYGALLIADEVMTGFGRTGIEGGARGPQRAGAGRPMRRGSEDVEPSRRAEDSAPYHTSVGKARAQVGHPPSLFACHQEGVQPDFMALAKALTGGYLPMAATLTTQAVFDAFLGEYEEFKTFFHGHSFTANQLGAAAGLASLEMLETSGSARSRRRLEHTLRDELNTLWSCPNIGDIRQVGLVVGVELVRNWRTREPFDLRERAGIRVCEALARRGVLTRPIGNVVVLMPPYCTTQAEAHRMVAALGEAVTAVSVA
jgi:adenosylmethionine---8-amino-7-oxononanoate aminotransferase